MAAAAAEQRADVNDVSLELEDLRKTLETRTAELDAEKETVMRLQRCCRRPPAAAPPHMRQRSTLCRTPAAAVPS